MNSGHKRMHELVTQKQGEHAEDVGKEIRQYGQVRPVDQQVGSRTWKSYSKIRFASQAFRDGYDEIFWGERL